jgi:hypothetical protein
MNLENKSLLSSINKNSSSKFLKRFNSKINIPSTYECNINKLY